MLHYPYAQFELTTVCNLNCFYCAGRQMPQKYMDFAIFQKRFDELPAAIKHVNLQGEGEPTLHPDFEKMTRYSIERGKTPYTITNFHSSAVIERSGILDYPLFGISLDSMDDAVLQKIGRSVNTVKNIEKYISTQEIEIFSVSFGQDLKPVGDWCKSRGYTHLVQPLQAKPDYVQTYQIKGFTQKHYNDVPFQLTCQHIHTYSPYFTVDGEERPCCYIKTKSCPDRNDFKLKMQKGMIPDSCQGCHLLSQVTAQKATA